MDRQQFDLLLAEAIDEVLTSLGEPVKNQLYIHLESNFLIDKNQIPKHIPMFSKIIHRIFGTGACLIEIKLMKSLCAKINDHPQTIFDKMTIFNNDLTFASYVREMKQSFELC